MTRSTLDPENVPAGPETNWPPGHDVKSIGPSDSSDSGSDMAGPGLLDEDQLGLDRGTNEDSEGGIANVADAGASVGPEAVIGKDAIVDDGAVVSGSLVLDGVTATGTLERSIAAPGLVAAIPT